MNNSRDGMQLRENSRSEVEAEGLQPGAEGTRPNSVGCNGSEALERCRDFLKALIPQHTDDPLLQDSCESLARQCDEALSQGGSSNGSAMREALRAEIINAPETADFMAGVPLEAAHQRERWGAEHDAGKNPFDWFWLVGYLAQKAASSAVAGDTEKAKHHTISTAAALANWHASLDGLTDMRPGIGPGNGGDKPGSAYAKASLIEPATLGDKL